jgi:hypothetical protein
MVEIPLSQGLVALVDDEDAERVSSAGKWFAMHTDGLVYARANARRPDGGKTSIVMHKFLTGFVRTDHRNGNGLDNRRSNLRPATNGENMRNARRHSDNRSGFKGVSRNRGRWRARIQVVGGELALGRFDTAEGAARAYDAAALLHFGEFARVNFPDEVTV